MKKLFTRTLLLAAANSASLLPMQAQVAPGSNLSQAASKTGPSAPWAALNVAPEDVRISSAYRDARSGLDLVYVEQLYLGLPIYKHDLTLAFAGTRLAHKAGVMVAKEKLAGLSATPAVAAQAAVQAALRPYAKGAPVTLAAKSAGSGPQAAQTFAAPSVARRDIEAKLMWSFDKHEQLHLVWNVNVDLLRSDDWLNIQVDAISGAPIGQDNWTVYEQNLARAKRPAAKQPAARPQAAPFSMLRPTSLLAVTTDAQYLVVPYPKGDPTQGMSIESAPWLKAGASNNATTHGWHYDGTTTYNYTRGNNVSAYDDPNRLNQAASAANYATSSTAVPSLTFNFVHDFNQVPNTGVNRSNAVTNLFYWNNIMHDIMYQYGLDEVSGNFQTTNLSRGGAGNDAVRAEAQDGSGTNNANFSTPADGTPGRMQMYLFDGPPTTRVTAPSSVAGDYYSVESAFSTANKLLNVGPKTGPLAYYNDATGGTHEACTANTAMNLSGKIAVIYRGNCDFVTKVKEAQTRGALAVLMINNAPGDPISMGGTDNTITIPAVMISQSDGLRLTNAMSTSTVSVTLLATPQLDGDLDSGIMAHEYGHGVSTRLTGGPANSSCLNNAEQGGEGWSDYLALMVTTNWASTPLTDGPTARPMGTYVMGQPATTGGGIRRYPYSTSMSINPLTYADVALDTEVHNIGEIWCATLWDMTWNIIQQQGTIDGNLYNSASTAGNNVALQLVMMGMKLQPCSPGFLDARDAILEADELLYGGSHRCAIWNAFARRGMGVSAVQGSSGSATDQTAAYDVPGGVRLKRTAVLSGNTFTVSVNAECNCSVPLNNYSLKDVMPAGMQFVSGTGATVSGNTVTFSNINFTTAGQTQTLTFQAKAASGASCAVTTPIKDDRDGNLVGGLTPQSVSGRNPTWTATTALFHSGTKAWQMVGDDRSDVSLTSGAFTPGAAATLSFYHYYNYESGFDGGNVEISVNNGTWQDAGPYFLENGYNATTSAYGMAFTGTSAATSTPADFIKSTIDLTPFSNSSIRVRFRSRGDANVTSVGWTVDDILVNSGCGGAQVITLYDAAGARPTAALASVASTRIVTFLTSSPLPVELLRFDARWQSEGADLTWATASEHNADQFVVERSLDGISWTDAGTRTAAGSSTQQTDYRLLDAQALTLPATVLYYRLRQLDKDGSTHYSPVRTLSHAGAPAALTLTALPNPLAGKALNLSLAAAENQDHAILTMLDATGRELWTEKVALSAGRASAEWPKASSLPAGLYLVRAQLPNGQRVVVRVVQD